VSIFLRHAEEILEIAAQGVEDIAILIDRQGGVRMMDPTGWSLTSLRHEYGCGYVYKVDRHAGMLRVEGWDGTRRCLLQRPITRRAALHYADGHHTRCSGEHRIQEIVGNIDRGSLRGEFEAHNFAVLGHPNTVDQTELGGIVRVFNGDAHQVVPKRQYDSL
jgi:hypothetical protein